MSALKCKTREMLAAHRANGGQPPASAGTSAAIGDTIAALRADLEVHRRKSHELDSLIARLVAYAGTEESPLSSLAPARRRRAGGRPPIDPSDELRARKAKAMRLRRQRIRDEASAAAAVAPPPAKPQKRQRKKAVQEGQKAETTAADAPPAANGHGKRKRKRNPRFMSGESGTLTEWETSPDGTLSRSLVSPGERVPLKDEHPAT
jgi:hypothetical protein